MIFLSVFLYLISVSLGTELVPKVILESLEEESPLVRCFEKCQEKDAQIAEYQDKYSNLQNRYTDVLQKLQETTLKYAKSQAQIIQNNNQVDLLNEKIDDLKKTCDLERLTNQLREDIEKLHNIIKGADVSRNETRLETQTIDEIADPKNPKNETSNVPAFPDRCPPTQNDRWVLQDIQLPGSDPFKVFCYSHEEEGSGWMTVYSKTSDSYKFNRSFEEYRNEFGDEKTNGDDEYFIGLEKLHLLTSRRPHEMLFWSVAILGCNNFVVGNESEGYMVKVIEGCNENKWMSAPMQGTKFSTYDRDEDGDPDLNWAEKTGFAWWFDSMYKTNILFDGITLMIRRKD